jgi:hypothetical protein
MYNNSIIKQFAFQGDPTPTNAIPKEGYISGTKLDTCQCLSNSVNDEEQVKNTVIAA